MKQKILSYNSTMTNETQNIPNDKKLRINVKYITKNVMAFHKGRQGIPW